MPTNRLKPKVLIVDDQENWRDSVSRICRDLGLNVKTASSIDKARKAIRSTHFGVMILDMIPSDEGALQADGKLPEVDIFLEYLRNKHVSVILFSGSSTIFDRHRTLSAKGMDVHPLLKRASVNEIADIIKQSLKTVATISPDDNLVHATEVFIVHGRDNPARKAVSHLIKRLRLHAVVLTEQITGGQTIIEGLEKYSNAGFAVVLLTPDDIGYLKGKWREARTRARQNVILELGFCMGKLGRARVCALYKADVDLPSDYLGIRYIPMKGKWRESLSKEIQNALRPFGVNVDLKRIYPTN
jgi:predicted nucleotide-binding protein